MCKKLIMGCLSALLSGCFLTTVRPLGHLNIVSSKNIEQDKEYVKLSTELFSEKQLKKQRSKNLLQALDATVDRAGGVYLMNARSYVVARTGFFLFLPLSTGYYYAFNGDVYGVKGQEQVFQGFKVGDKVTWRKYGKYRRGIILSFVRGQGKALVKNVADGARVEVELTDLIKTDAN